MNRLIDKPSPITGGPLELRTLPASVLYRGETISYEKSIYHCMDSGLEFTDDDLEAANLKLIYDTYRRRHGIPLAEELRQMRERYGIPSSAISLILGLGENQFGLYEEGTVPTVSVGRLLALAMEPLNMKELLLSSKSVFTEKQYKKYYSAIESSLHPAIYENDAVGVKDFGPITFVLPIGVTIKTNQRKRSVKKEPYNEYVYANAC